MVIGEKDSKQSELIVLDERMLLEAMGTPAHNSHGKDIKFGSRSYILVWTGRRGSGKTTDMALFAIFSFVLWHKRIISNFPIECMIRRYRPDGDSYLEHLCSEPLDFEKLMLQSDDYNGCIILIDECPDIISHMASQSWRNRLVAAFTRQIRKTGASLFLGAQDLELIDKQMRWQVDIEVVCKDGAQFINNPDLPDGSILWLNWIDKSGCWTGYSEQERLRMGLDPVVLRLQINPCFLWGDATHKAAFDSWRQIDIIESLRRVDMKLKPITMGDKQEVDVFGKYPVADSVKERALTVIQSLRSDKNNQDAGIYQTEFYKLCGPMSDKDKNNASKILSEFGVTRGADSNNKRFYMFGDSFDIVRFSNWVKEGDKNG